MGTNPAPPAGMAPGQRLVRSRPDLVHQVTRWQALVAQNWQARDVEDVAAYLNQEFYRLPGS